MFSQFTSRICLPLMLLLLLIAQGSALAAVDCFSCHDRDTFQRRVKHQPADDGECFTCHNPHVAPHEGLIKKAIPRLCFNCHEDMRDGLQQAVVHQPVRDGQCLACHHPHSSDQTGLLNARLVDTCLACHTGLPKQYKYTHQPYAQGKCSACHEAHQSDHRGLLVKEPTALCLGCHDRSALKRKHADYPGELKNCGTCHSPHGSDRKGLIRNVLHQPYADGCGDCHSGKNTPVGIDTCLNCHEDVEEQMASSHNHLVRYKENGCIACHSPHAGDDGRLLKGSDRYVCSTCHLDTFQHYDAAHYKHVKTASCADCHAPHGSNFPNMTKAPINAVCYPCHEKHSEFSHPIGEDVFDPRTQQILTCASCHAVKGTQHESHLRYDGHRALCIQCHRDI
ncbi:MAG: cytochrome c3 family protein [Desulfuromonadaceae bacterium]